MSWLPLPQPEPCTYCGLLEAHSFDCVASHRTQAAGAGGFSSVRNAKWRSWPHSDVHPRIVVSQPEINPFSPFLNTINQDLCPGFAALLLRRLAGDFPPRITSLCGAVSGRLSGPTRPTIVTTLGAQWTKQFGVSPPEHLGRGST